MKAFFFLLALVGIFGICSLIGQPAFVTVMAVFAVMIGGLTGALAGLIIGTNFFGTDYRQAFGRWLLIGSGTMAALVLIWTTGLDLLDGGLSVSFFPNLWYATFRLALASSTLACGIMATWAYLHFTKRSVKQTEVIKS